MSPALGLDIGCTWLKCARHVVIGIGSWFSAWSILISSWLVEWPRFHLWFERRTGYALIAPVSSWSVMEMSVQADIDRRLGDVEYWQGVTWRWLRSLDESWGEEVSTDVIRTWIRELQGNEKKLKEKIYGLEVTKEILEEVKEWNQEKSRQIKALEEEVKELKGQVEDLKATKAEVEMEEEVTILKDELKTLKAEVEAMKAKKPMKAWPVNSFSYFSRHHLALSSRNLGCVSWSFIGTAISWSIHFYPRRWRLRKPWRQWRPWRRWRTSVPPGLQKSLGMQRNLWALHQSLGMFYKSFFTIGNSLDILFGRYRFLHSIHSSNHFSSLGILWAFFSLFTAFFSLSKAKKAMKATKLKKDEEVTWPSWIDWTVAPWRTNYLIKCHPKDFRWFVFVNRAHSHPKPPHTARWRKTKSERRAGWWTPAVPFPHHATLCHPLNILWILKSIHQPIDHGHKGYQFGRGIHCGALWSKSLSAGKVLKAMKAYLIWRQWRPIWRQWRPIWRQWRPIWRQWRQWRPWKRERPWIFRCFSRLVDCLISTSFQKDQEMRTWCKTLLSCAILWISFEYPLNSIHQPVGHGHEGHQFDIIRSTVINAFIAGHCDWRV